MEQPAPATSATKRALPCTHPPTHQKKNHSLCFPFSFILLELCFTRKMRSVSFFSGIHDFSSSVKGIKSRNRPSFDEDDLTFTIFPGGKKCR